MLLGNFYKKMKRPQDAIAAYRDALARDNEHQNALFSLALAYKDEGRFDEARVGFERARELDPEEWEGALAARRPLDAQGRFRPRRGHRHRRARAKGRRAPASPEARRDSDRGEAFRRGRARAQGARSRRNRGWRSRTSTSASSTKGKGQIDKAIDVLRGGARGKPQRRIARRSTPRSFCRRVGRSQRGDRAFPQGRRDRTDVRHRPPLSRQGVAGGRRSRRRRAVGTRRSDRTTPSRGWRRSATTCSRTSTSNRGAPPMRGERSRRQGGSSTPACDDGFGQAAARVRQRSAGWHNRSVVPHEEWPHAITERKAGSAEGSSGTTDLEGTEDSGAASLRGLRSTD